LQRFDVTPSSPLSTHVTAERVKTKNCPCDDFEIWDKRLLVYDPTYDIFEWNCWRLSHSSLMAYDFMVVYSVFSGPVRHRMQYERVVIKLPLYPTFFFDLGGCVLVSYVVVRYILFNCNFKLSICHKNYVELMYLL